MLFALFSDVFSAPAYTLKSGVLTISGSGEVTRKDVENAVQNSDLYQIDVGDGITSIQSGAFSNYSKLVYSHINAQITSIPNNLHENCVKLLTFKAPATVKTIGAFAFYNCQSLTTFEYPDVLAIFNYKSFFKCENLDNVTKYSTNTPLSADFESTIRPSAFANCTSLKFFDFPTNVVNISDSAFRFCRSLNSSTFPTTIRHLGNYSFDGCSSLGNLNLSSIKRIGANAFSYCTSIQKLNIGDDCVYIGDWAFKNCETLEDFTTNIPAGISYIGNGSFAYTYNLLSFAFPYNCHRVSPYVLMNSCIESVIILSTVRTIGEYAFSRCKKLSNVAFVDLETEGITDIYKFAFAYCEQIIVVRFNNYLKNVHEGAFLGCRSLETFHVTENLKNISPLVFSECNSIHNFTVNENNPNYALGPDGAIYDKELKKLVVYPTAANNPIPKLPPSVTVFMDSAFRGCTEIDTVEIPDTVTQIGKGCFQNSSITSIVFPARFEKIESYTFNSCKKLKTLKFQDGSKLTSINEHCFEGCYSLQDFNMPETVTHIGTCCFKGCQLLTGIKFDKVKEIMPSAFEDCKALKFANLQSLKFVQSKAFHNCYNINEVILGPGVQYIYKQAFSFCVNLKQIALPKGLVSLGPSCFANCTSLESMDIPATVKEFQSQIFSGCTKLVKVTIRGPVQEMLESAFEDCSSLVEVDFLNNIFQISEDAFSGNLTNLKNVTYCGTVHIETPFLESVRHNKGFHVYVGSYYSNSLFAGITTSNAEGCVVPPSETPTPADSQKNGLKGWQIGLIAASGAIVLIVVTVIIAVCVMKAAGFRRKETLTESLLTQTV